ncbi:response regulator transcription factor [Duganella sp. Dugasp56]|uniref:helix-turn-helix transcriptional regulator n=1 Tax=Duganella sp. Dugasp56 TaxID=3243046 RepID=UPI0039AEE362
MTISHTPADTPANARSARSRYRHSEGSAARLRLLTDAGIAFADDGNSAAALNMILAKTLAFLSMEEGVLLYRHDDGLHVHAAQGPVAPVGARLPITGALHAALLENALPLVQQDIQSRLRIGRDKAIGLEVLVPLRFHGRSAGILALMSARPVSPPNADDLSALQILGTMFAAAYLADSKPASRAAANESAAKLKQLTSRELQVFAMMPRGLTNAAMAQELGIAAGTVKVHIERILHKLDLRDRTQAAVYAVDCGFGG